MRILREQDPTIAFRFACRVDMCGSCGMVINGKERLACRTNVSDFPPGKDITLRPLNHFPVIKDLVVDLEPLFRQFEQTLSFYEPGRTVRRTAPIRPTRRSAGISAATPPTVSRVAAVFRAARWSIITKTTPGPRRCTGFSLSWPTGATAY